MADRVLVYGVTGSGKSTLAEQPARRTGLPWQEMDNLTFEPGWIEVPHAEQRRRVAELCAGDRWVIDAAYPHWQDLVLNRVQLIVALDYPRLVSLRQLVGRTAGRVRDRRPICNGNTESLRSALSRESILRWHFQSFDSCRALIRAWVNDAAAGTGPPVHRLDHPSTTRRWLAQVNSPADLR